ncbi:MAG: cohesin domain-containing protein [Candidatus Paceibacterota bacterium]|jgi:hypothetical protein
MLKLSGLKKIFSIFLTAFFAFLFLVFPNPAAASGASLYLSPDTGTVLLGGTFDVSVFLNTGANEINTVQASLKFDPKKVQIVNPAVGKSFISVWVAQPSYSNTNGTITFQGGVPSPGINTSSGLISTITFRAIAPGKTSIDILDSSKVLLNDGKGTNVLTSRAKGEYEISIPPPEGPKVFSPTHPDQNKWYQDNNPSFGWEKEEGVEGFSYSIDRSPYGAPDNSSEGEDTSASYSELEDGIWYFHIKAKKAASWGGISHYLVQLDRTPPASFSPGVDPVVRQPNITTDQPLVTFFTTDASSGLGYYQIKLVGLSEGEGETGFFVEANSPYRFSPLDRGEYEVIVRAFDNAGNWRDSSKKIAVSDLQSPFYSTQNGIFIFNLFISWLWLAILILALAVLLSLFSFLHRSSYKKLEEKRKDLNDLVEKAKAEKRELEEKIREDNGKNNNI